MEPYPNGPASLDVSVSRLIAFSICALPKMQMSYHISEKVLGLGA
jgi:hypothetical protein